LKALPTVFLSGVSSLLDDTDSMPLSFSMSRSSKLWSMERKILRIENRKKFGEFGLCSDKLKEWRALVVFDDTNFDLNLSKPEVNF
jgi:hypothetical protein